MFLQNKDITNYIHSVDVEKLPIIYDNKMEVDLFGSKILVEPNEWLWHLHLKLTDVCNAKCGFCVEQKVIKQENSKRFIERVDAMMCEMERAGILYSVSVTGGEPLMFDRFDELCEVLKKHDIKFLTMNTNGKLLEQNLNKIDGLFDFVDISRHNADDSRNNLIFNQSMPTIEDLRNIKSKLKHTRMRIQCVLCDINTIKDLEKFIDIFSFADDLSFRKLMKLSKDSGIEYDDKAEFYHELLEYVFSNFEFVEQTVQDYYVYEIWRHKDINITFSYSNMEMLYKVENMEDDAVCREFIVHPDGTISGSWNKNKKIILR